MIARPGARGASNPTLFAAVLLTGALALLVGTGVAVVRASRAPTAWMPSTASRSRLSSILLPE